MCPDVAKRAGGGGGGGGVTQGELHVAFLLRLTGNTTN